MTHILSMRMLAHRTQKSDIYLNFYMIKIMDLRRLILIAIVLDSRKQILWESSDIAQN